MGGQVVHGQEDKRVGGAGQVSERPRYLTCLYLASCLLFLASCLAPPAPVATYTYAPTLAPTSTATPVPSPSPVPTDTPTPVPTITPTVLPVPTIDPLVVRSAVSKVQARLAQASIEPLCLRWEDTDADGAPEWVGLYLLPSSPPRLAAFVLDGETWFDLRPLVKEPGETDYGLGEYPTCEMEVRDTNGDGRIEVLVWGHAETSTDLLHIFGWDGATYLLLGAFEGDMGVRLSNTDGDLADEVAVRYNAGSDLVWEAVHTWDGANYGWTWERYDWFYLDRPHAYLVDTPEHVVISFYLAVDDRDIPGAYGLLSASSQAAQAYEAWVAGFATTVAAEVGVVHERARSGDMASVAAQVLAYDNVDGRIVATLWDVEWAVVQAGGRWWLERANVVQLDQWELTYYR
jgi:hypothetical protein